MQTMNEVMPKKEDKVNEGKAQSLNEVMPKKIVEGTEDLNEQPEKKLKSSGTTEADS